MARKEREKAMAITKLKRKNQKKTQIYYQVDVYVRGVKIHSKLFEKRLDAEIWHEKVKSEYIEARQTGPKIDEEMTFGDCIKSYLQDNEGFLKQRKPSQQSMQARLCHFTDSPISSTKMVEFCGETVDEWFDWILKQPTAKNPGLKS